MKAPAFPSRSLAAAAALVACTWVAATAQQQPPFRTAVDLVSLNVTVSDGATRYITDLNQEDFSVFEDGVKQEVTFFNKTNLPIALALLLDTSASMEAKLPTAQEAAMAAAATSGRQRKNETFTGVPVLP